MPSILRPPMNLGLLIGLSSACAILMIIERLGVPTTLQLSFKGDIKRESQWLAQYGQAVATGAAALLVWRLDKVDGQRHILPIIVAVSCASIGSFIFKRLLGRVRPNREKAGKFLGPSLRHENYRESFPSSHSACAVALTVMLAHYYPDGTPVFWAMALTTASLRYLLDAHWPSDILGGIGLGYSIAWGVISALGSV